MQTVELYTSDAAVAIGRPWTTGTFHSLVLADRYREGMRASGFITHLRDATPAERRDGPFPRLVTVRDIARGTRRVWR